MKNFLPFILTAVISLLIGIVIGNNTASHSPEASDSESQVKPNRNGSRLSSSSYRGTYREKIQRIMRLAPQVEIRHASDTDDPSLTLIGKTINTMSLADIEPTLEKIKSLELTHDVRQALYHKLFKQWATLDGEAATNYALTHALELKNIWLPNLAMHIWSKTAPYAADEWLAENQDKLTLKQRIAFHDVIIQSIAKKDFSLAFEKAKTAHPLHREKLLKTIGRVASQSDQHASEYAEYLASLDYNAHNAERQKLERAFIEAFAAYAKFDEAIAFIDSLPADHQSEPTIGLSHMWSYTEPQKSLDWLYDRLGNSPVIHNELSYALSHWAKYDTHGVDLWMSRHPEIDYDIIRRYSIPRLAQEGDFPGAVRWGAQIKDADKRTQAYQLIYHRWEKIDPNGATQWLKTLPAEDREIIESP